MANWIALGDCVASGGATFYAGINSIDLGGNTGWSFTGTGFTTDTSIGGTAIFNSASLMGCNII